MRQNFRFPEDFFENTHRMLSQSKKVLLAPIGFKSNKRKKVESCMDLNLIEGRTIKLQLPSLKPRIHMQRRLSICSGDQENAFNVTFRKDISGVLKPPHKQNHLKSRYIFA